MQRDWQIWRMEYNIASKFNIFPHAIFFINQLTLLYCEIGIHFSINSQSGSTGRDKYSFDCFRYAFAAGSKFMIGANSLTASLIHYNQ